LETGLTWCVHFKKKCGKHFKKNLISLLHFYETNMKTEKMLICVKFKNGNVFFDGEKKPFWEHDRKNGDRRGYTTIDSSYTNVPRLLPGDDAVQTKANERHLLSPILSWLFLAIESGFAPEQFLMIVSCCGASFAQPRLHMWLSNWLGPSVVQIGGEPSKGRITLCDPGKVPKRGQGPCVFVTPSPSVLAAMCTVVVLEDIDCIPDAPTVTTLIEEWAIASTLVARSNMESAQPIASVHSTLKLVENIPGMQCALSQARIFNLRNAGSSTEEMQSAMNFIETECNVSQDARVPLGDFFQRAKEFGLVVDTCANAKEWVLRPVIMQLLLAVRAHVTPTSRNMQTADKKRRHTHWVMGLSLKSHV
jgi:hypothetical protein